MRHFKDHNVVCNYKNQATYTDKAKNKTRAIQLELLTNKRMLDIQDFATGMNSDDPLLCIIP